MSLSSETPQSDVDTTRCDVMANRENVTDVFRHGNLSELCGGSMSNLHSQSDLLIIPEYRATNICFFLGLKQVHWSGVHSRMETRSFCHRINAFAGIENEFQ